MEEKQDKLIEQDENKLIKDAVNEIKNADAEQLEKTIKDWFNQIRNSGMKIGAQMVSSVVFNIIKQNTQKAGKVSLNDYRRCMKAIVDFISVQLNNVEDSNDGQQD